MASIFTYDPDPPRISSPWPKSRATTPAQSSGRDTPEQVPSRSNLRWPGVNDELIEEVDAHSLKLEAEPQEGPTEYKLHLLLRPRRSFLKSSTGHRASGSSHSKSEPFPTRSASEIALSVTPPPPASSNQPRQHRLEQLTTQLLWRLQQSCPHHSSSAKNVILPELPSTATELTPPKRPSRLLPGLEESKGALYEIGVSDDGTLVGLAEDEMEESLNNLRAMAASLGCNVLVQRMVAVGDCEWALSDSAPTLPITQRSRLWVAEAMVKPDLNNAQTQATNGSHALRSPALAKYAALRSPTTAQASQSQSEQLRITLTGTTMSGKSTLLGTLSTSTMDNGRGKSRLSLLRHRHEIQSGMTTSITQELVGYKFLLKTHDNHRYEVINLSTNYVSAWNDIHVASERGRLVFLTDTAGHPRYRRTTLRGLMGWAPHWTLLCIAADDAEESTGKTGSTPSAQDVLGEGASNVDLSQAHLDLCIRLDLPIAIVITKLDLASKLGLRQTLTKVLSVLKEAGRQPVIVPRTPGASTEPELQYISTTTQNEISKVRDTITHGGRTVVVPIVLTSALSGDGIETLHALLNQLPLPHPPPGPSALTVQQAGQSVFHVEDLFDTPALRARLAADVSHHSGQGAIVSGYLGEGKRPCMIGDELIFGPFHASERASDGDGSSSPHEHDAEDDDEADSDHYRARRRRRTTGHFASRSLPGLNHSSDHLESRDTADNLEWRRVKVVSIRNLRLPVRTLLPGQVGTLGIMPCGIVSSSTSLRPMRRGMVLIHADTSLSPHDNSRGAENDSTSEAARRTFTAEFAASDMTSLAVGNVVVAYIGSVRASAKIIAAGLADGDEDESFDTPRHSSNRQPASHNTTQDDTPFAFELDDEESEDPLSRSTFSTFSDAERQPPERLHVTFRFLGTAREYIPPCETSLMHDFGLDGQPSSSPTISPRASGAQVLIVPGGGPGLLASSERRGERGVAGLEGYVGVIVG